MDVSIILVIDATFLIIYSYTKMKLQFYTLLYIDREEKKKMSATGLSKAKELKFQDRINIFLSCAALLNKSLVYNHVGELNILTNDSDFVSSSLANLGCSINMIELTFSLQIPRDINFYSAHYKIDVFKWLGNKPGADMLFLLDNDMVCTGPIPQVVKNIVAADYTSKKFPMLIYNMPRYYGDKMVTDKQKVDSSQIHGLWAGGEFIAGTATAFAELYKEVMKIQDGYWNNYHSLFHQGDEMLTSVALENLFYRSRFPLLDAHGLGLVKRFWSILTKYPYYKEQYWFAHLPYDKGMISSLKLANINSNDDLIKAYKAYWRKLLIKRIIRKFFSLFSKMQKGREKGL